jgi:hypothetical protein
MVHRIHFFFRHSAPFVRLLVGCFLFLTLTTTPGQAQGLRLVPMGGPTMTNPDAPGRNARVGAVKLPFFDDFSTVRAQPDPALWLTRGGAFVNNTIAINPPSVNVVTFDGLGATGQPYVLNNQFAYGPTDTLTSQPIDLAGLALRDSVYLSFYWQRQGLGELPDPGDSLRLQFLDNTNTWRTVWKQDGGRADSVFYQVLQPVRQLTDLHGAFQFRFQSWGRSSGAYDTWHVDYVYLNRGRSFRDRTIKDVATQRAIGSYLKRYTAMPLTHYLLNPTAETADSVSTTLVNLFDNFNFTTTRFRIRNETTGDTVQRLTQAGSVLIPSLQRQVRAVKPAPLLRTTAPRAVLRYTFDFLTTDDQNPSIPTVNLRRNDTLSATVTLADYYAYDDGSAEYGVQVGPRERAATRFVSAKPDALTAIRGYVLPFNADQTGLSITFGVYASSQGKPGALLYQRAFPISYSAGRNGFVEFKFERPVPVKDTFYIGWQQVSNDLTATVRVGFDKNSPFSSQLFYSPATTWEQNGRSAALNLTGAVMLRPVLSGNPADLITAVTEEPAPAPLRVYPNPTPGRIGWDTPNLRHIDVFDMSGRLRQSLPVAPGRQTADLTLAPGLYLLRLSDGTRTVSQRVLVSQ